MDWVNSRDDNQEYMGDLSRPSQPDFSQFANGLLAPLPAVPTTSDWPGNAHIGESRNDLRFVFSLAPGPEFDTDSVNEGELEVIREDDDVSSEMHGAVSTSEETSIVTESVHKQQQQQQQHQQHQQQSHRHNDDKVHSLNNNSDNNHNKTITPASTSNVEHHTQQQLQLNNQQQIQHSLSHSHSRHSLQQLQQQHQPNDHPPPQPPPTQHYEMHQTHHQSNLQQPLHSLPSSEQNQSGNTLKEAQSLRKAQIKDLHEDQIPTSPNSHPSQVQSTHSSHQGKSTSSASMPNVIGISTSTSMTMQPLSGNNNNNNPATLHETTNRITPKSEAVFDEASDDLNNNTNKHNNVYSKKTGDSVDNSEGTTTPSIANSSKGSSTTGAVSPGTPRSSSKATKSIAKRKGGKKSPSSSIVGVSPTMSAGTSGSGLSHTKLCRDRLNNMFDRLKHTLPPAPPGIEVKHKAQVLDYAIVVFKNMVERTSQLEVELAVSSNKATMEWISKLVNRTETFPHAAEEVMHLFIKRRGWLHAELWIASKRPGFVTSDGNVDDSVVLSFRGSVENTTNGGPSLKAFSDESKNYHFRANEGVQGRVWSSMRPEWVTGLSDIKNFRRADLARKYGLKACLAVPVTITGKIEGIMCFYDIKHRPYDSQCLELAMRLAWALGNAIGGKRAKVNVLTTSGTSDS